MTTLFYLVPAASVVALLFAWLFFRQMKRESEGTPTMKEIAQYVREGAMAYLKQQYKVVIIVFAVLEKVKALKLKAESYSFSGGKIHLSLRMRQKDSLETLRNLVNKLEGIRIEDLY